MASDPFEARLREGSRELDRLYEDVRAPTLFRQDWQAEIFARRSLGDGVRVHAWSLAEYFLLAWGDWHGLLGRYWRYFRRSHEELPVRWERQASRCGVLAEQLFHESALGKVIAREWEAPLSKTGLPSLRGQAALETICHEIVLNHRRLVVLVDGLPTGVEVTSEATRSPGDGATWSHCRAIVERLNGTLVEGWHNLPRPDREEAVWQFRHYRRTNLLASWLRLEGAHGERPLSALLRVLSVEKPMLTWVEQAVAEIQPDEHDRDIVRAVLSRIATALSDFSYDDFVEDVCAGSFRGGVDSPVGTDAINLIPSKDRGPWRRVLVAVSRGDKKALGFTNIMRQVREHLIDHGDTTRTVIVLCDHWTKTSLDEHIRDLRAHHRRGIRFLFFLAGSPGKVLAPVAVDLSRVA